MLMSGSFRLSFLTLVTCLSFGSASAEDELPNWVTEGTYVIDKPGLSDAEYRRAVNLLVPEVEAGNVAAMHFLGRAYTEGKGVPEDDKLGYDLIKQSADGGYAYAQGTICKYHMLGQSFAKDLEMAKAYCEAGAKQGNPLAQMRLGRIYQDEGEDSYALFWYEEAAKQGDAFAAYWAGTMYLNGEVVTQDLDKAQLYLGTAAMAGDRTAQFKLGYSYYQGDVLPKDDVMALQLYKMAAYNNHIRGQLNYGMMFWGGMGGAPEDLQEAYKWMLIAGRNTDCKYGGIAKGYQAKLTAKLTKPQEKKAEQDAANFVSDLEPKCSP